MFSIFHALATLASERKESLLASKFGDPFYMSRPMSQIPSKGSRCHPHLGAAYALVGFADPGFDFAVNSGMDIHGRVIQIDLGELTFSRGKLVAAVENKNWLFQNSYLRLGGELRSYFEQQMNKHLTVGAVDQHWDCHGAWHRPTEVQATRSDFSQYVSAGDWREPDWQWAESEAAAA